MDKCSFDMKSNLVIRIGILGKDNIFETSYLEFTTIVNKCHILRYSGVLIV